MGRGVDNRARECCCSVVVGVAGHDTGTAAVQGEEWRDQAAESLLFNMRSCDAGGRGGGGFARRDGGRVSGSGPAAAAAALETSEKILRSLM